MAYTCHLCNDAEPATILITPLKGGDTMAIGQACLVMGYCGLLSVLMDVDAEQLYDGLVALQALTVEARKADAQDAPQAKPRAPRKPRTPGPGRKSPAVPESAPATG